MDRTEWEALGIEKKTTMGPTNVFQKDTRLPELDKGENILWSEDAHIPWHSKSEYFGGVFFTNKRTILIYRFMYKAYGSVACPYDLLKIKKGETGKEVIFDVHDGDVSSIKLSFKRGAFNRIRDGYLLARSNRE